MSSTNFTTLNVTVDDFDAFVSYSDSSQYTTSDPSNETSRAFASQFYQSTFHSTSTVGTSFSLNFTGTAVYVFGASGPAYGSYEVSFDGNAQNKSAYAPTNATEPFLLFNTSGLPQTTHSLKVTNLGSTAASEGTSLLLDWIHLTADFGAPGAEIKSTIIEETDPALKFTGKWGHNTNPSFSGGGTTFTQEDNASVSLTFRGSAIYVYGDTNANHGLFTVSIDNTTIGQYHGTVGCGLTYTRQGICEQIIPGLNFFTAGLDDKEHTIKIVNNAGPNSTFLDIDRFIYYTPTKYLSPSNNSSGSKSGSTSPTYSPNPSSPSAGLRTATLSPSFFWAMLLLFCLWRRLKL